MDKKIKIYDCFLFFNEIELLEIRLSSLYNHVDYFVIVEGNYTFTAIQKPFIFEENKEKFNQYLDKIIYIKIDTEPKLNSVHPDPMWNRLYFLRDNIMKGLTQCNPDDVILISDLDEIWNPSFLPQIKPSNYPIIFLMKDRIYFINCKVKNTLSKITYFKFRLLSFLINRYKLKLIRYNYWHGTVGYQYKNLPVIHEVRYIFDKFQPKATYLKDAGVHYSYLGGLDRILIKLQSHAHPEVGLNWTKETLNQRIFIDQKSVHSDRINLIFEKKENLSEREKNLINKYPNLFWFL